MFAGSYFAGAYYAGATGFSVFQIWFVVESNKAVGWRIQRV